MKKYKYITVIVVAFIFFNILVYFGSNRIMKKYVKKSGPENQLNQSVINPKTGTQLKNNLEFIKKTKIYNSFDSFLLLLLKETEKENNISPLIFMGSSINGNEISVKLKGNENNIIKIIMTLEKMVKNGYLKSIVSLNENNMIEFVFTLYL